MFYTTSNRENDRIQFGAFGYNSNNFLKLCVNRTRCNFSTWNYEPKTILRKRTSELSSMAEQFYTSLTRRVITTNRYTTNYRPSTTNLRHNDNIVDVHVLSTLSLFLLEFANALNILAWHKRMTRLSMSTFILRFCNWKN